MSNPSKEQEESLYKKRHSMAHVMAQAVTELLPGTKVTIGPPIEDGFYYDFDTPRPLLMEDLPAIEDKMREILKTGVNFEKKVISREEAREIFKQEPYKLEILEGLPEGAEISIYTDGPFVDLCKGPHVNSLKELDPKGFKLMNIAGAYWRGDEKRPMLQRIYATLWDSKQELDEYLENLKERERRDHRKLGKSLDLFSIHEEAGPGLIYWHPKGSRIRIAIEDFWRKAHFESGYEMLFTPHVGKSWLWETSGHLDFYKEGMYNPMEMDKSDYYIRPMNCPFHIMIYKNAVHSYRDLPLRWAELGTVYRYEKSGVLHGTMRVRGFTQDDAHIFCTPEQIEGEIEEVLNFSLDIWKAFGFKEIKAYLATRPEKAVGEEKDWQKAVESLEKALKSKGIPYETDEGGGAFYGPKIDLKIKDSMGREWQMSTIQFDFNLPERFNMTFVDSDGSHRRPFMVHRALLGSLERFFGVLIEHFAGAFPLWLSPMQVQIIPVSEKFNDYAYNVQKQLRKQGIRVNVDDSSRRMNAKIRIAQEEKIPYMFIVGESESVSNTVSVRLRNGEQIQSISLEDIITRLKEEIENKTIC